MLAGADEFRLTNTAYQPGVRQSTATCSANPLDPLCDACIGPLNTDARHRFTLSAVYQGPWGINVSGMFRYRSATPYTAARRRPERRRLRLDLPAGWQQVNSERGDSFSQLDLRLAKEFTFGPVGLELIAEMFNVFNEENPARLLVQRGTGTPRRPPSPAIPLQGEQRLTQLGLRVRF